jgi:hypothetical protein
MEGPKLESTIQGLIYTIRNERVMFDADLAALYGVSTSRLNEQVRRNLGRFPADFAFVLTREEAAILRSQIAISKKGRGGARFAPMAFTEHGVAMLSSVLHSPRAVAVNVEIIRAFVRLRVLLAPSAAERKRIGF